MEQARVTEAIASILQALPPAEAVQPILVSFIMNDCSKFCTDPL